MYPSTIYSQTNPTENTFIDDTGFFLDVIIGYLNDNITAIETKLGIDGSAVATSIDYLLKNPLSIDPGHKHTSAAISLATDQNFVTDAQLTIIGNTSGENTGDQVIPSVATGAEVNTGTSDDTIVTPKALADSDYAKTSDITVTADSTTAFSNKDLTSETNSFPLSVSTNATISAASYTTDTGSSLALTTRNTDFIVTAQAGALKFNNPTGAGIANGWKILVRIKDNGTARALTYDTQFRAMGNALPTTTILSKTLYMGFIFNSADTKWDLVALAQEE